jgi:hypothetical protein
LVRVVPKSDRSFLEQSFNAQKAAEQHLTGSFDSFKNDLTKKIEKPRSTAVSATRWASLSCGSLSITMTQLLSGLPRYWRSCSSISVRMRTEAKGNWQRVSAVTFGAICNEVILTGFTCFSLINRVRLQKGSGLESSSSLLTKPSTKEFLFVEG